MLIPTNSEWFIHKLYNFNFALFISPHCKSILAYCNYAICCWPTVGCETLVKKQKWVPKNKRLGTTGLQLLFAHKTITYSGSYDKSYSPHFLFWKSSFLFLHTLLNSLPDHFKTVQFRTMFRRSILRYLTLHCFYSEQEYLALHWVGPRSRAW